MANTQNPAERPLKAVTGTGKKSGREDSDLTLIERPCYGVYETTTTVEGITFKPGVYYHGIRQSGPGDEGTPFNHRICAPLYVVAEAVDREDESHGLLLKFRTRRGWKEWIMPMSMLSGKGEELLKDLLRQGHKVNHEHRAHVARYISQFAEPDRMITTTRRPGWHESDCFVLPSQIIGNGDIRFQQSGSAAQIYSEKGSLEEWKYQVAQYCLGNPVLILSVCCALAGPLLAKVGVNGGGVHLVGDSSTGKSLAQLVAASVWGNPSTYAASWDVSKNGLEIEAASRNDAVLILDEIRRANPRTVQDMTYMLANGGGKGTMTKEREGRAKLSWRLLVLSSGEKSLAEHAAISGDPAHAGAELRMVDVNAGTRTYRAFDDLHGMTGEAFHRTLTTAIGSLYGSAGPAFVARLIQDLTRRDLISEFTACRDQFDVENAQAGRVADRFALIALAGELATAYGILPWPIGTASEACNLLFEEWIQRVGKGNTEDRQILSSISDFLDTYGDIRFTNIESGAGGNQPRAGFYMMVGEGRHYLFTKSGLREAAKGYSPDRILRALTEAKALMPADNGRAQRQFRINGLGKPRFYVINPENLRDPSEGE